MAKFRLVSFSKEIPIKFKWINWIILIPIFLWPLVFFMTIFFFDDPNANPIMVWTLFLGVNLYPLYLLILFELNARLYKRIKVAAYILPLLIIGSLSFISINEFLSSKKFAEERKIEVQKLKDAGYIGNCETYKIKDNTVSYKDSIMNADPNSFENLSCHYGKDSKYAYKGKEPIIGSDPETFEIIDWQWQRDKNLYYYKGNPMNLIDYNSFKILIANYSKDKHKVYFYDKVIENADPNTFEVNQMTHIGTDKNNKYKFGKEITNH